MMKTLGPVETLDRFKDVFPDWSLRAEEACHDTA